MKRLFLLLPLVLHLVIAVCQKPQPPDKVYGQLFEDVQRSKIFPDGKTFVDCIPKKDPKQIVTSYLAVKNNPAVRFSLRLFVESNFIIPQEKNVEVPKGEDVVKHIKSLWKILRRDPDTVVTGSSLLPCPIHTLFLAEDSGKFITGILISLCWAYLKVVKKKWSKT